MFCRQIMFICLGFCPIRGGGGFERVDNSKLLELLACNLK